MAARLPPPDIDHAALHVSGSSQYSTVQYSTVQYSTVQYSTVQHSTVQHITWSRNQSEKEAAHILPRFIRVISSVM